MYVSEYTHIRLSNARKIKWVQTIFKLKQKHSLDRKPGYS